MVYGKSYNLFNKEMTKIAQSYLAQGYAINTTTMNGRKQIDLRNGKNFVRIWVESESSYHYPQLENKGFWGDIYFLRVGSTTLKYPNTDSVWNDDLTLISERKYYEVGRWSAQKAFTDNEAEAIRCAKLRGDRLHNHTSYSVYDRTVVYKDINRLKIGFSYVKKLPQTKSIHLEHIDSVNKVYSDNRKSYWYEVKYHTVSGISKTATMNFHKKKLLTSK